MIICSPRGARAAGSFCFGDIDSNGNEVVQYWYDAWGNHKVVNSSGVEITDQNHIGNLNPFRYRGYYYDRETGLYFLQTRYYDPEIGRFLNRDSVAYADPQTINGLNLYAYCLNNPVAYVDPTGHFVLSFFIVGAFVGFAVSFGGSAISQAITNNGNIDWAVAAVDGVFGALSGALATTGIGIAVSAFIDAGLTLANEAIVVGMQNNWQYSNEDWMRIGINSGISALTSFALDLKCIGLTNSAQFKAAKSAIKTFKSKVARNAYKHGQKSIDTAAKYVNKLILKSFTTKDAFISYSSTLLLSFI